MVVQLRDFQILGKLGSGAYSTVYRVRRNIDQQEYALKKVSFLGITPKEKQNALNEVRLLASLNHQNIISYKGIILTCKILLILCMTFNIPNKNLLSQNQRSLQLANLLSIFFLNRYVKVSRKIYSIGVYFQNQIRRNLLNISDVFYDEQTQCLCLIMEIAQGGDLFEYIQSQKKQGKMISEEFIWKVFLQILQGLSQLHYLKISHRDLKSANIFILQDGLIKVGDLNVSKVSKNGMLYTQTGTPFYASPEVWKDQPYDLKADIWSLGCIVYELATYFTPFQHENMDGLCQKIIKGKYNNIDNKVYSNDLNQLISMMLQTDSASRPSCGNKSSLNMILMIFQEDLLKSDFIKRKLNQYNQIGSNLSIQSSQLMHTIYIPRKMNHLNDILPQSKYDQQNKLTTYRNPSKSQDTLLKSVRPLNQQYCQQFQADNHRLPMLNLIYQDQYSKIDNHQNNVKNNQIDMKQSFNKQNYHNQSNAKNNYLEMRGNVISQDQARQIQNQQRLLQSQNHDRLILHQPYQNMEYNRYREKIKNYDEVSQLIQVKNPINQNYKNILSNNEIYNNNNNYPRQHNIQTKSSKLMELPEKKLYFLHSKLFQ